MGFENVDRDSTVKYRGRIYRLISVNEGSDSFNGAYEGSQGNEYTYSTINTQDTLQDILR